MNKNTELEKELLALLKQVKHIIKGVKDNTIYGLSSDEVGKFEDILKKVSIVYPTVKFPSTLRTGCGSCVGNFIKDMMPVYDRLSMQDEAEAKANVLVIPEEIKETLPVVEKVKKRPMKRKEERG